MSKPLLLHPDRLFPAQENIRDIARRAQGFVRPRKPSALAGQMLTEMAAMSVEDGLVMQIHPGSFRNHNSQLFTHFGRNCGADIPTETEYVKALRP